MIGFFAYNVFLKTEKTKKSRGFSQRTKEKFQHKSKTSKLNWKRLSVNGSTNLSQGKQLISGNEESTACCYRLFHLCISWARVWFVLLTVNSFKLIPSQRWTLPGLTFVINSVHDFRTGFLGTPKWWQKSVLGVWGFHLCFLQKMWSYWPHQILTISSHCLYLSVKQLKWR